MKIAFEFVGGPLDGKTLVGVLGNGSDAERHYLFTNHGTVGQTFKVASDYTVETLASERDQNFRLTTESERRYVVKIANSAEQQRITDFQIQALLHLEKNGCGVAVPRIFPTLGGATSTTVSRQDCDHTLRVVSYLPGRPR